MLKLIPEAAQTGSPIQGRCPKFAAYSQRFFEEASPDRRPAMQRKERTHIAGWVVRSTTQAGNRIHRTPIDNVIADLVRNDSVQPERHRLADLVQCRIESQTPRQEANPTVRVAISTSGGPSSIRIGFTDQRLTAHGDMDSWSLLHEDGHQEAVALGCA
jgi:hypothetical protein